MRRRVTRGRKGGWTDGTWRRVTLLGAFTLSILPSFRLSAQDLPANDGALFLVFPVGAYAVGMGQAASTLEGRAEAAFWNPAGLATLERGEFIVHTTTLAAGRISAVGAYVPSPRIGVIGAGLYLVDYGDLEATDSSGAPIARVSPRNLALLASYATSLPGGIVIGVNYKLVEFRVDCTGDCRDFPEGNGTSHALDIGGQIAIGEGQALRLGVALRNLGFRLQVENEAQADPLPARFVVGAVYRVPLPAWGEGEGAGHFDLQVAADVQSSWGEDGRAETRVGFDLGFERLVRLRGGYAFIHDGLSGPSIGIGLRSGSLGVDLARLFVAGSDLVAASPTFFSFRLVF
jgi:hypothetical protein